MIKNNAIPNCQEKMEEEAEVKHKEKGGERKRIKRQKIVIWGLKQVCLVLQYERGGSALTGQVYLVCSVL